MKKLFLLLMFFPALAFSQTPAFSFRFKLEELMSHGDTCTSEYSIELARYSNKDLNDKINWFGHDTSEYDWDAFKTKSGDEFIKETIKNKTSKSYIVEFEARNSDYVFNNFYEVLITRFKCGKTETMKFSFPIHISSFITFINLGTVYFISGDFNIDKDIIYTLTEEGKYLNLSLPQNYWIGK